MFDFRRRYASILQVFRERGMDAVRAELMGVQVTVFRDPGAVALITKAFQRFPKTEKAGLSNLEEWLGNGLVNNNTPTSHAAVKEVLMPAFKAASIKGFVPTFARSAEEMADVLASVSGQAYDITMLCRRATLDVIGRTGFGFEFHAVEIEAAEARGKLPTAHADGSSGGGQIGDGRVDVARMLDAIYLPALILAALPMVPRPIVPGILGFEQGIQKIDEVVEHMLQERRANGIRDRDTDLLSFMLRAQQEGNTAMTDKQIRDELQTMIMAGSDTTATTLHFALYELSRNPDVLARCVAEVEAALGDTPAGSIAPDVYQTQLPLLTGVCNETLRLYPAVPELPRECIADDVIGGYSVTKGTVVFASMYSCQRHEKWWPRPDDWLPDRWLPANAAEMAPHADKAFLPFSMGPRACIGRHFAMLELVVLLAVLIRRLDFTAAPGPELVTAMNFTLGTKDGCRVVPRARGPGAAAASARGKEVAATQGD